MKLNIQKQIPGVKKVQKIWDIDLSKYKNILGMKSNESIFERVDAKEKYDEIKQMVMTEFNNAKSNINADVTYDFEKKVYLDEIENYTNGI